MSEKIYACLLRLYPVRFRRAHGENALQLFGDRLRDETGFVCRARLWLDVFIDLANSLPRLHVNAHPAFTAVSVAHSAGTPLFFVIEDESVRPAALFSGCAITMATLSLFSVLLNPAGTPHGFRFRVVHSEFRSANPQIPAASKAEANSAAKQALVNATPDSYATSAEFFPPPIEYSALTDVEASAASGSLPWQVVNSRAAVAATPASRAALDPERQRVLDAVIANVKQHYFDPAVAQQLADDLVARQRRGDYAPVTDGKDFAALLTTQMRDVSHDMHLEVVYNPVPPRQPTQEEFARMLDGLRKDNCSFKKVQILSHNIGYLKLDAFLDPSACGATATVAMSSLNHADALIFDLRDNRGGTAEMVSLLSSYLFDHPEYMFDPRRVPTPQSWTASPVPGSKLANKPVFILTSSTTVSAAEQFTYDLKMLKRATIVAETTAGGAHAGVWLRIDDHYGMAIPENRPVNPYSKSDWEATGIQPDIKVPAANALQAVLRLAQTQLQKK